MTDLLEILYHALLDSVWLLPFLFLTYLLMELLEHRAGDRVRAAVSRAGRAAPLLGGAVGLVPQCGFSAAAAGLFAGRVITPGTLIAVFLATSDEMLPIFLGAGMPLAQILTVLGIKLAIAVGVGFLTDLLFRDRVSVGDIESLCEEENCHCGERGVLLSALLHTLQIFLFVFVINLLLGGLFHLVGEARLAELLSALPVLGPILSALVGLVPNCAASVLIATLYTKGVITGGAMIGGLLTGAGAGLLVLFRTNHRVRENLLLTALLLAVGIAFGSILDLTGLDTLMGL